VGARKKSGQVLVAFAAETERLSEHAIEKLKKKRADLVVANDVSRTEIGFGADENQVTLFYADGRIEELPKMRKEELALELMQRIGRLFAPSGSA